jgi:hypothetical protein
MSPVIPNCWLCIDTGSQDPEEVMSITFFATSKFMFCTGIALAAVSPAILLANFTDIPHTLNGFSDTKDAVLPVVVDADLPLKSPVKLITFPTSALIQKVSRRLYKERS